MTAELLFRADANLRMATAHVVAIPDGGVEFDRTDFHSQGGRHRRCRHLFDEAAPDVGAGCT